MIRIAALNDDAPCGNDTASQPEVATKEAQEEEAFAIYNKALQLQNQNDYEGAEEMFMQLLKLNFLAEVCPLEDGDGVMRPNLLLKYSALKNLANIAVHQGNYMKAMEYYIEAITLDASDVSLWFRIGTIALKIHNFPLAKLSFQEGLKCNPDHWPCLDNLITVLYALNDYISCLYFIAQAFEKEPSYVKGFALRDKIFQEHPSLRRDSLDLFKSCDESIFRQSYDKEEAEKYVEESLEMRKIKRDLDRPAKLPILHFTRPWKSYTWKCLGECLIALYDHIAAKTPELSFGCKVNLEKYLDPQILETSNEVTDTVEPMDVISSEIHQVTQSLLISSSTPAVNSPYVSEAAETLPLAPPTVVVSEPQSEAEEATQFLDGNISAQEKVSSSSKRGPKKRRLSLEFGDTFAKRRSARVRNTTVVKKQDNVNYCEILQKFLPSSLLAENNEFEKEVSEKQLSITIEKGIVKANADSGKDVDSLEEVPFLLNEEENVRNFLNSYKKNSGVLDLLYKYLVSLGGYHKMVWPSNLPEVFMMAYTKLRDHTTHPSLFCQEMNSKMIKDDTLFTLLYSELKMDNITLIKSRAYPVLSPGSNKNLTQVAPIFPPKYREDLEYLTQATVRHDILGDDWQDFTIRVLWLRARYLICQGQTDFAVDCFDRITSILKSEAENGNTVNAIRLYNCKLENIVTLEQVQKQFESLQRCQSLEEVHRLYENGDYQQVVELLTATFHQYQSSGKIGNLGNLSERHAQLQLLQDSLLKLSNYEQCLYWGEIAFNEALQQYSISSSKSSKANWFETMTYLLTSLERCLSHDVSLLKSLKTGSLVRFAQNLIQVITIQLESLEFVNRAKDTIVYPWTLFYRLIDHEEKKIRALVSKKSSKENSPTNEEPVEVDFGPGVPSSLMLLYNAHEFLGRRSWCCNSEGALLLLYVNVLLKELNRYEDMPHPYKEDLEASLEQCFYCLYSHPHKRTRVKHLQEHNATQIPLTWERAVPVFEFFKPKQVPEFDSHKASTVSTDLEILLRRIIALVPSQHNPANNVDKSIAFIEGTIDELPQPTEKEKSLPIVGEIYYLLADYYFKNKEFGKAIRYYTLDICVNPERLDSWAGMALARSSQLEQKLNSVGGIDDHLGDDDDDDDEGDKRGQSKCELKNEGAIYRKSKAALCCFQRALEIDENNTMLWIEYGSASYMLHSHASRQLKQKEQFCLTTEVIESLKVKRSEMLQTAKLCFQSANRCSPLTGDEEEWLHHYMLGKICEKQEMPITTALYHYEKAAFHLHEKEARYPRRIQYHNPPEFAMESLEVYYRTHDAALKYLMKCDEKSLPASTCEELYKYLKRASESPFALFQEKSRYSSLSSSDVDEPMAPPPGEHTKYQYLTSINYDHDYFRRKRKDSSAEDSETEHRLRHSIDSSSESFDSATVKDILNSMLAVVAERNPSQHGNGNVLVVLGDAKIKKFVSQTADASSPENENSDTQLKDSKDQDKNNGRIFSNLGGSSIPPSQSDMITENSTSEVNVCFKTKLDENQKNILEVKKLEDAVDKYVAKEGNNKEIPGKSDQKTENDNRVNDLKQDANSETQTKHVATYGELIEMCLAAMKQCLQRFPQHYKSLYRLAYYYSHTNQRKNLHWSRDYLLGRKIGWQQLAHMPCQGLFSERKNTNLFNGIWRIPNEDIDRPGSFGSHMYRSVVLLIEVLKQLKDYNFLINLTLQLHRNPDTGKKFLRDMDRLYLYGLTQDITMASLRNEMKRLCDKERTPENNEKIIKHLLAVYRAWHNYLKCASNPDMVNKLLEDAYQMYKQNDCEKSSPLLEQAAKFCQMQISFSKLPKIINMSQSESSRLPFPNLASLSQLDPSKLNYSNIPNFMGNERKSIPGGNETDSIIDPHAWRTEALENAAKLLLSSNEPKSDIIKLKEKSELSIKSIGVTGPPTTKEKISTSSNSSATREIISKVINEKSGTSQAQSGSPAASGKMAWNTNNIPASGMIIGSMTIMPVGMNSPPAQAEGLLGRLAGTRPKSPLDLSSAEAKKPVATTSKPSAYPPFDPGRLTADVQSKISSLDPVEHASRSNISGFQMEFMRQIAQRQLSVSRSAPTRVQSLRNPAPYPQKPAVHQAWGSSAPIAVPTSATAPSHSNKVSSTSSTKTSSSSVKVVPSMHDLNKKMSSASNIKTSSSVKVVPSMHDLNKKLPSPYPLSTKDNASKNLLLSSQASGIKEIPTKQSSTANSQSTVSKEGAIKTASLSSVCHTVIQKEGPDKSSPSSGGCITISKDNPSKLTLPSQPSDSKESTVISLPSPIQSDVTTKTALSSLSVIPKESLAKKSVTHSLTSKDVSPKNVSTISQPTIIKETVKEIPHMYPPLSKEVITHLSTSKETGREIPHLFPPLSKEAVVKLTNILAPSLKIPHRLTTTKTQQDKSTVHSSNPSKLDASSVPKVSLSDAAKRSPAFSTVKLGDSSTSKTDTGKPSEGNTLSSPNHGNCQK